MPVDFPIFIKERKLEDTEFPHTIYVKTYKQSDSRLALRKWIFTLTKVNGTHIFLCDSQERADKFVLYQMGVNQIVWEALFNIVCVKDFSDC